ncbi:MAG: hypothetical protein IPK74_33765 [Deltaproteobacteria bacterium]|nr:hypothetical protein [Deltaproteobacteria bacterium]
METAPEPGGGAPEQIDVLGLWRWTVPVHALLPLVIWLLHHFELEWALQLGFFAIHFGFPVLLAISYPLWEGQGVELVGLLVLDHLVTFAVGLALFVALAP